MKGFLKKLLENLIFLFKARHYGYFSKTEPFFHNPFTENLEYILFLLSILFTTLQINENNVGLFLLPRINALAPPTCTSCGHTELWKYLVLNGKFAHKHFKWFWYMLLDTFSLKLAGSNITVTWPEVLLQGRIQESEEGGLISLKPHP